MSRYERLRTPRGWLTTPEYVDIQILDCDGWTGAEWEAQTPLSRVDFEVRLAQCSISMRCHSDTQ